MAARHAPPDMPLLSGSARQRADAIVANEYIRWRGPDRTASAGASWYDTGTINGLFPAARLRGGLLPVPREVPVVSPSHPQVQSFDLVIFGGTGDLAARKLLPAMFHRFIDGQIPADSRIIGIA